MAESKADAVAAPDFKVRNRCLRGRAGRIARFCRAHGPPTFPYCLLFSEEDGHGLSRATTDLCRLAPHD